MITKEMTKSILNKVESLSCKSEGIVISAGCWIETKTDDVVHDDKKTKTIKMYK